MCEWAKGKKSTKSSSFSWFIFNEKQSKRWIQKSYSPFAMCACGTATHYQREEAKKAVGSLFFSLRSLGCFSAIQNMCFNLPHWMENQRKKKDENKLYKFLFPLPFDDVLLNLIEDETKKAPASVEFPKSSENYFFVEEQDTLHMHIEISDSWPSGSEVYVFAISIQRICRFRFSFNGFLLHSSNSIGKRDDGIFESMWNKMCVLCISSARVQHTKMRNPASLCV